MRTPSRYMPKYQDPPAKPFGTLVLCLMVAFMAGAGATLLLSAPLLTGCAAVIGWLFISHSVKIAGYKTTLALRTLAASRPHNSICHFARSFDCRAVDTWIIRAVYEELQEELVAGSPHFPVRANDYLCADLLIDPEDLDMSLAPVIAQRTGRSLEHASRNPYWGKTHTVADLVMFFNAQPRS